MRQRKTHTHNKTIKQSRQQKKKDIPTTDPEREGEEKQTNEKRKKEIEKAWLPGGRGGGVGM